MCVVHVRVQCSDKFSELHLHNVEDSELTIESIIGTALLQVFDMVHVEDVTLHHSAERDDADEEDKR